MSTIDQINVNTLRFLAVDAIEQANSGHPGLPLGAASMAYVLWDRFLRFNPRNPAWPNRDRFVLSAGHGSALLYALLHVYGFDLPLEELKRFRQWNSKTPGHPEHGHTPGVEATTGPLGQGFAMGVGMAMAERYLAAQFNRPGFPLTDHYTYAIVSDGDLMEGIASEAASLAATLGLGKLIYLYDNNHISIEGSTDLAFTEDVEARFDGYGWHTLRVSDGNDLAGIEAAIKLAQGEEKRPSLILIRNHIGYGSPKQDTAAAHGEPLGAEALEATKKKLQWPLTPAFHIPEEAHAHFRQAVVQGAEQEKQWQTSLEAYTKEYPQLALQFNQASRGELPADWDSGLSFFPAEQKPTATRSASGQVMNQLAEQLPNLFGGSADLAPSTKTNLNGFADFSSAQHSGRNIHFGIREHAMGAVINGMALHQGVIPFGATFMVFSDYLRPALRLAAMMRTHTLFIFTHDSIGMGEDGPTHQPVEQLMSLRAIPGLTVLRPADANETVAAWRVAIQQQGPVALVLTRQNLPVMDPDRHPIAKGVAQGAYIFSEAAGDKPQLILMASGSELHLILEAQRLLEEQGVKARVVSMPSWELFEQQPAAYRQQVLPPDLPKLAVETGISRGWRDFVGERGDVIGLNHFGASAPGKTVLNELGFNTEHVVQRALLLLAR